MRGPDNKTMSLPNWKLSLFLTIVLLMIVFFNYEQFFRFDYPDSFQIKDFPFIEQPDRITCGPASATMLLNYYGVDVDLEEVRKHTKTDWFTYQETPIGMTSPDYIERALKDYKIKSKRQKSDVDHIKYYVSEERPPIVLVRSGLNTWHYVVVIGYDKQNLILADPAFGKERVITIDTFNKSWEFSGDLSGNYYGIDHWMLFIKTAEVSEFTLIVPKQRR